MDRQDLEIYLQKVGFEVLTAVSTKMAIFWVVAPCSLVEDYQRFRGPCCLHHQGDASSTRLLALQPRRQPSSYLQKLQVKLHFSVSIFNMKTQPPRTPE
jgi:hypothetical protein